MTTAFITHSDCELHDMGAAHPDSPKRLRAIQDALVEAGLFDLLVHHEAPRATDSDLLAAHTPAYLEQLRRLSPDDGLVSVDQDTLMSPHTLDAAYRAAGASVMASDLVLSGRVDNVFCSVRPAGHHAEPDRAMGFCFFNNVAIGVLHALKSSEVERAAILDFDAHQANGPEAIFRDDNRVLICSSFQHHLFPDTPFTEGDARIVNTPLPAGSGSTKFRSAVETLWQPAIERFEPHILFVSAGFDAHMNDPLSNLYLVEDDFRWVSEKIVGWAGRYAQGRVVSTLEGGYDLGALGRSVTCHVRVLMG